MFDAEGIFVFKCYTRDLQTASPTVPPSPHTLALPVPGMALGTYISRFPGADMDLSSRLVWTSKGFPKERFLSMAFTRICEEENRPVRTAGLTPGSQFKGVTTASLIIQLTFYRTTAKSMEQRNPQTSCSTEPGCCRTQTQEAHTGSKGQDFMPGTHVCPLRTSSTS